MNTLILSLKREYWEYRRVVIGIPLILSVLVVLASVMATMYHKHAGNQVGEIVSIEQNESTAADGSADHKQNQTPERVEEITPSLTLEQLQDRTPFRFMAIYMAVAWFASLFYLLSSLYSDRKDKSILYWKSMPVSETQNVLSKFLFGAIGFPLFAIAIAWAVYLLLYIFGLGAVNSPDAGDSWEFVERTFDGTRLFFWPLIAAVLGALWGAPFFSFALLVSAASKRIPFLTMLLPLIIIAALERIVFSSSYLIDFFTSHFPFQVLAQLSDEASIRPLVNALFVERASSLVLGLALGAIFIVAATWYRNKRFEI